MTALLDTHAFLWIEGDPARVPAGVRAYLTDPAWVVYLSAVSVWEMAIKVDSGKLVLRDAVERIVEEALANTPLQLLPVEAATPTPSVGSPASIRTRSTGCSSPRRWPRTRSSSRPTRPSVNIPSARTGNRTPRGTDP